MARSKDQHSSTEYHSGSRAGSQPMAFVWSVEMLTVEEFAARMQVGETTVWNWIGDNTLVQGRHYWKNKKIVRFPWGPELISNLMADCIFGKAEDAAASVHVNCDESPVPQKKGKGRGARRDILEAPLQPSSRPAQKTPTGKRRSFGISPINPDMLKR